MRVLVVEDEPMISLLVEEWLAELGFETVGPAATVAAALALVESGTPQAAILDLSVGGQETYQVAEALRQRSIPFVFATGYGSGALRRPFENSPVLSKPFEFEDVRSAMAALGGRA